MSDVLIISSIMLRRGRSGTLAINSSYDRVPRRTKGKEAARVFSPLSAMHAGVVSERSLRRRHQPARRAMAIDRAAARLGRGYSSGKSPPRMLSSSELIERCGKVEKRYDDGELIGVDHPYGFCSRRVQVCRATACSAVTWFAVLRNFELIKNGPSASKNRWGRFFCLPPQPRCACGEPLAVALPTDWRQRFAGLPT